MIQKRICIGIDPHVTNMLSSLVLRYDYAICCSFNFVPNTSLISIQHNLNLFSPLFWARFEILLKFNDNWWACGRTVPTCYTSATIEALQLIKNKLTLFAHIRVRSIIIKQNMLANHSRTHPKQTHTPTMRPINM